MAQVNIDGRRAGWRGLVDQALARGDHVSVYGMRDDFAFATRCYNPDTGSTFERWNQGAIAPCPCPSVYIPDGFNDCFAFTPGELAASLRARGEPVLASEVEKAKCRTTIGRKLVRAGSAAFDACKCQRGDRGITLEMFLRSLEACAGRARGANPRGAEAFTPSASYVQQSRVYFGLPVTGPNLMTAQPTNKAAVRKAQEQAAGTTGGSGWGWLLLGGAAVLGVLWWKRSKKS